MKKLIAASFLLVFSCVAAQAKDLSTHPIFKHYIGTWKAAGELKGNDGNNVTITEEWTGKVDGDNAFLIEGTRTMNGETQPFKWTITYNEGTDSFDAVLTGPDPSQTLRFETHASEATMTVDMKAVTGNGDSAITVHESFPGDSTDVFESKVVFTGESGQTTLEGVIKNERQKVP
ncbi:MAG: hypothetical protein ACO1TE_09405 [Prosthecobacter sp.]